MTIALSGFNSGDVLGTENLAMDWSGKNSYVGKINAACDFQIGEEYYI